jgi:4-diphosphocytidyl-2-C-methyl-D-erythritol kinase
MERTTARRPTAVEIDAPAKVNLALDVFEREPSGYHRIETYFQMLELADHLHIELTRSTGIELEVEGAELGSNEENLAYRAARAYLRAAGRGGVHLLLEKRIPAGAGLGGGSSDAAATLRALDALIGGLPEDRLVRMAAELGSDVPFFLCGSTLALGRGRGERLTALPPLPAAPVILAFPGVHVSTAAAYHALDRERGGLERAHPLDGGGPNRSRGPGGPRLPLPHDPSDWSTVERFARNDFEELVCAMHAEVARVRAALRRTGPRFAMLSGSGSALFAVYPTQEAAQRASAQLRLEQVLVEPTRTAAFVPAPRFSVTEGTS